MKKAAPAEGTTGAGIGVKVVAAVLLLDEHFLATHDVESGSESASAVASLAKEDTIEAVDVIRLRQNDVCDVYFVADVDSQSLDEVVAVGVEVSAEAAAGDAGVGIDVVEEVAGDVVVSGACGHECRRVAADELHALFRVADGASVSRFFDTGEEDVIDGGLCLSISDERGTHEAAGLDEVGDVGLHLIDEAELHRIVLESCEACEERSAAEDGLRVIDGAGQADGVPGALAEGALQLDVGDLDILGRVVAGLLQDDVLRAEVLEAYFDVVIAADGVLVAAVLIVDCPAWYAVEALDLCGRAIALL